MQALGFGEFGRVQSQGDELGSPGLKQTCAMGKEGDLKGARGPALDGLVCDVDVA